LMIGCLVRSVGDYQRASCVLNHLGPNFAIPHKKVWVALRSLVGKCGYFL
jgi:hypothetical protein